MSAAAQAAARLDVKYFLKNWNLLIPCQLWQTVVELSCGRSARDNKSARDVRMIEKKYAPPHWQRRGNERM